MDPDFSLPGDVELHGNGCPVVSVPGLMKPMIFPYPETR